MGNNYDVIIIGGGFAGVTAARELSQKGHKTLILEAQDRLGGRTWTDKQLGMDLEMGGTWVHWYQPHIWSEIMRYDIEVAPMPEPEEAYWIADNKLEKGSVDDVLGILGSGMKRFSDDCFEYVPMPFEPLAIEKIKDIDHMSVRERMDELNLTKKEYDLVSSLWSANFLGPIDDGALTQAFRWLSLSNNDWKLCLEICSTYKMVKGTRHLIECIVNDSTADVMLSKPVTKVEKDGEKYHVLTRDGEKYTGKTVISTVSLAVLKNIEFNPPLSEKKRMASKEGQNGKGLKVWVKVRNVHKPFVAFAPSDYAITYLGYYNGAKGEATVVGFGPDSSRLDLNNKEAVEQEIRHWFPEAEVIDCVGHDWVADEFVLETQHMAKTNQLTQYIEELRRPEGGIFIAGSGYADGWSGLMDGAIESALKVSKQIDEYLALIK